MRQISVVRSTLTKTVTLSDRKGRDGSLFVTASWRAISYRSTSTRTTQRRFETCWPGMVSLLS
jgi:hypothetical protein